MVGTSIKSLIDLFKPEYLTVFGEKTENGFVETKSYHISDIPPALMIEKVFPCEKEAAAFMIYSFGGNVLWVKKEGRKG